MSNRRLGEWTRRPTSSKLVVDAVTVYLTEFSPNALSQFAMWEGLYDLAGDMTSLEDARYRS